MKDEANSPHYSKNNIAMWLLLWSLVLLLFLSVTNIISCTAVNKGTKIPTYEEAKKRVLSRGPLVKPKVETQLLWLQGGKAAGVFEGESVQTVDPTNPSLAKPVSWGAVVIDAKKAAELKAIKDQRDLLLKKLEAAKLQRDVNKIIHEAALQKAKEAARRTWWERNQGIIALTVGGTLGAGLIVGIVYALTRGSGLTVNTNTMVLAR